MEAQFSPDLDRKRRKFRSAWISFAGRIVAQLIGAAGTVALGVIVFGNHLQPAPPVVTATAAQQDVLVAKKVRTPTGTLVVLVPLDRYREVTPDLVELVMTTTAAEGSLAGTDEDAQPLTPVWKAAKAH